MVKDLKVAMFLMYIFILDTVGLSVFLREIINFNQ